MPDAYTYDPSGMPEFGPSGGGFPIDPSGFSLFGGGGDGGFGIDPTGFNFSSGGFGGLGDLMGQFFLDTTTGQTFSGAQIINDPTLWADFSQQQGLTDAQTMAQVQATRQLFNQMGGSGAGGNQLNPYITAALLGIPAAVGIGGLIQGLTGGGQSTTQVTQPGQSATAQAAQQAALQGFQGAQQFAFGNPQANLASNMTGQIQPGAGGLAGQLQGMAPLQQQAQLSSIQGLMNQMQTNPFLAGPYGSAMQAQGQPWMQQGQPGQGAQPWMQPQGQAATGGGWQPGMPVDPGQLARSGGVSGGYIGPDGQFVPDVGSAQSPSTLYGVKDGGSAAPVTGWQPGMPVDPGQFERSGGVSGGYIGPNGQFVPDTVGATTGGRQFLPSTGGWGQQPQVPWGGSQATGPNPILAQLARQVQGYGQAQSPLLALGGLGAMGLQNPAAGALGQQAQGMAQGNLPALSPALRQQVGATFEPQRQDIARYLDQALRGALERSRQQGFAGGNEVFREGTPAALLAPGLAEATRQQGVLGGQQAAMELSLAQSLPMQGGNLANQLFQQQLAQNQALQQAAQGYTTPLSVALGGGLNLSNLNQNIIQALGGFGQQGTANQLDFLRAISAPLGGLSGLSNTAQLGAGSTTTQNQPFNLLNAFAPTASLLGGIGGALTGIGALQGNPSTVRF